MSWGSIMIYTINKDFLRRVMVVGTFSLTLPFLAISNSYGDGHIICNI